MRQMRECGECGVPHLVLRTPSCCAAVTGAPQRRAAAARDPIRVASHQSMWLHGGASWAGARCAAPTLSSIPMLECGGPEGERTSA